MIVAEGNFEWIHNQNASNSFVWTRFQHGQCIQHICMFYFCRYLKMENALIFTLILWKCQTKLKHSVLRGLLVLACENISLRWETLFRIWLNKRLEHSNFGKKNLTEHLLYVLLLCIIAQVCNVLPSFSTQKTVLVINLQWAYWLPAAVSFSPYLLFSGAWVCPLAEWKLSLLIQFYIH